MLKEEIKKLQQEKDVVILAHYYVDGAVQEIADYVGDSYYLSKVATKVTQKNILFCGVSFMDAKTRETLAMVFKRDFDINKKLYYRSSDLLYDYLLYEN